MKKTTIAMMAFCFCFAASSSVMASVARENPVHKKRQEVQSSKTKETYGLSAEELGGKKSSKSKSPDASSNKEDSADKKDAVAEEKARKLQLAELMVKYDADEDGQISDEEMAAAAKAGEDKELKTLLAEKKARLEKNTKKPVGTSSTGSKKKSAPKEIVVTPNGE